MGKLIFICILAYVNMYAAELNVDEQQLKVDCLHCHMQNQIPNELIYRRYLMKYSTNKAMHVAIAKYLRNPKDQDSIMPPQFFLKFPRKDALTLEEETLAKNIRLFLETFDIKKKLLLPQ